jgi:uroporphyrinogen-III synthase
VSNRDNRHGQWRVCITRDESPAGPLATALRARAFVPVSCPVLTEALPADRTALDNAASRLEQFAWVICASARAAAALRQARPGAWPPGVRTAAVGAATARALVEAGATPPPLAADAGGADALWRLLADADDWPDKLVLLPTTPGGRRLLADELLRAGARVEEVEAYRMLPRSDEAITDDWKEASADAAVIASPRVARRLIRVVGLPALHRLKAVIAIGSTTAEALSECGVPSEVPARPDFDEVARTLAARRAAEIVS